MKQFIMISALAGLSQAAAAHPVETPEVACHSQTLAGGERIEIRGFGSFSLHFRPPRIGRNPKTGEEVPIHPRRVLTFRPSHLMKERVAAGNKA